MLGEVDPAGTITGTRKLDVYGAVRSTTGTLSSKHGFVGGLGHPSEDDAGLIYMRARWMDPVTVRFVSEDPVADGVNWFIYAESNPVSNVDRDGRMSSRAWAVMITFETGIIFTILAVLCFATAMPVQAAILANIAIISFILALGGIDCFVGGVAALGGFAVGGLSGVLTGLADKTIAAAANASKAKPIAAKVIIACAVYAMMCIAALALDCQYRPEEWR